MSELDLNDARRRCRDLASKPDGGHGRNLSENDQESIRVLLAELARVEHLASLPTVPASEHQRVQAEAAAMRERLIETATHSPTEMFDGLPCWCRGYPPHNEYCLANREALSAGAGWLSPEEAEKLRAEAAAMRAEFESNFVVEMPTDENFQGEEKTFWMCGACEAQSLERSGIQHEPQCPLHADAGSALLSELADLRAEKEGLRREVNEARFFMSRWCGAPEAKKSLMAGIGALVSKISDAESESADLRARLEAVTAAALVVTTDAAQDILEDPCGAAKREAAGFRRVHVSAMRHLNEVLTRSTKKGRDDESQYETVRAPGGAGAGAQEGLDAVLGGGRGGDPRSALPHQEDHQEGPDHPPEVAAEVRRAVEEEREACASVAEAGICPESCGCCDRERRIAAAIRARGGEE